MREKPFHTEEYKGYTIEIYPDADPESPRNWDNLGTMVCFHGRYNLGDEKTGYTRDQFSSWGELSMQLVKDGAALVLPLVLYDHSGITIKVGTTIAQDPQGWDSGLVGYTYVTKAKLLKEYGGKIVTPKTLERAEQVLRGEVESYDDYLTGNVYGYVVKDPNGEEVDSCWGFFGDYDGKEYGALLEAKSVVDGHISRTKVHKMRVEVVVEMEVRAEGEKEALDQAENLVRNKLGGLEAVISPFVEGEKV